VAEQDDRRRARAIVFGKERPASHRPRSHDVEGISGQVGGRNTFGSTALVAHRD